jgi:hypothetical protein
MFKMARHIDTSRPADQHTASARVWHRSLVRHAHVVRAPQPADPLRGNPNSPDVQRLTALIQRH